ncbi:unnamed protein product [Prorocentrum cordatum]|uniref:Uncharacterized protein n=1 Tax=Prorocentrum cordatum TaxID=2364126 RepID=A0ABN9X754_9DINO|nr:unnamed protein product [Polarella glacialis]
MSAAWERFHHFRNFEGASGMAIGLEPVEGKAPSGWIARQKKLLGIGGKAKSSSSSSSSSTSSGKKRKKKEKKRLKKEKKQLKKQEKKAKKDGPPACMPLRPAAAAGSAARPHTSWLRRGARRGSQWRRSSCLCLRAASLCCRLAEGSGTRPAVVSQGAGCSLLPAQGFS